MKVAIVLVKARVLTKMGANEGSRMPTTGIGVATLAKATRNKSEKTILHMANIQLGSQDKYIEVKELQKGGK